MPSDRLRLSEIRRTSAFRLTLLLGVQFAVAVVALLGLIYGLTAHELNIRSDTILRRESARLNHVAAVDLPAVIRSEISNSTSKLNYFALLARDGRPIVGNVDVPSGLRFDHPVDIEPGPGIPTAVRLLATRLSRGQTLVIGRDITPVIDLRHRMLDILTISGLSIVIVVIGMAMVLSRAPLRRVRDLQSTSRRIAAGELGARMQVSGRGDELDQFATTVNAMVSDVSHMVAQIKEVTDVVAHDLRTPLAQIRRRLNKARDMLDGGEAGSLIERSVMDLEMVLDRFAALLRISELEDHRRRAGFRAVSLATVVQSVTELYEPVAEELGLSMCADLCDSSLVHGDEKLIFEAVSNLVDNALKFSPRGAQVDILVSNAPQPTVEIRDHGPGIAVEDRQAVLRRFHRGANATEIPGSGVGLSIVMAIAHLHDFSFELSEGEPGLRAILKAKIFQ